MLKLQLVFIDIIQQFITAEAILSSKAPYRIEMLITCAGTRKTHWRSNPLKSSKRAALTTQVYAANNFHGPNCRFFLLK